MTVFWIGAMVILTIIELLTLGLTTIWFVGGCAVAFIISLLNGPLWLQVLACIIVSVVLLIFTRPFAAKFINKNRTKTNYESYAGREAKVIEIIDNFNQTGAVMLDGQEWTARSLIDSRVIQPGARVRVCEVKGVKLIVTDDETETEA